MPKSISHGSRIRAYTKLLSLVVFLLATLRCAHRKPTLVPLAARKCPAYSYEVPRVNHCFDPPTCSHVESWDGQLCMAFDPETKQPLGLFWKGTS